MNRILRYYPALALTLLFLRSWSLMKRLEEAA